MKSSAHTLPWHSDFSLDVIFFNEEGVNLLVCWFCCPSCYRWLSQTESGWVRLSWVKLGQWRIDINRCVRCFALLCVKWFNTTSFQTAPIKCWDYKLSLGGTVYIFCKEGTEMFLLRCPAVDIHVTGTVAKNPQEQRILHWEKKTMYWSWRVKEMNVELVLFHQVEPQARVVAAQYAAAVFPSDHVPSRYILMLGAGDV